MSISFGFLGTYPPTQCGIASFTRAMMRSLVTPESGDTAGVVRVVDMPTRSDPLEVVGHLDTRSGTSSIAAAAALNTFDVAIIQHEYGIYGGRDGDQLLDVLRRVHVPIVMVAHTVLEKPTPHQAEVLRAVIAASDAVVTMTDAASTRLVGQYGVDASRVSVIRHGANARIGAEAKLPGSRPLILTWGLIGPGKGIEWGIDGLRRLQRLNPLPEYVVAGQTHPRVRLHEGESYRMRLGHRARHAGVTGLLRFEDSYLDEAALTRMVRRADVVLLPYDSREQVTSGVLVEAVAAGKPVVATAFPHAVELLRSGAGIVVPQFDGVAIGEALYQVLTEPDRAHRMATEAARLAPTLLWPAVAKQYRTLATNLLPVAKPGVRLADTKPVVG